MRALRGLAGPVLFFAALFAVGTWAEHEQPHGPSAQDCERMVERAFTTEQLTEMGCGDGRP